jgi:hypothetical protein
MALTKRQVIGKIDILEDGQLQLRADLVIEEDGVELLRTYHRRVLVPGDDVRTESSRVQAIAGLVWTLAVIAAFRERQRLAALATAATLREAIR